MLGYTNPTQAATTDAPAVAVAITPEQEEKLRAREGLFFFPYKTLDALTGGVVTNYLKSSGGGLGALGPLMMINLAGWALIAYGAYSLMKKGGN